MAQQLANLRTPEAYAGVTAYARKHTGDAAATAYLALGHAYLEDKRYGEAEQSLRQVLHFPVVFFIISWAYLIVAIILSIIRLISGRKSKTLEDFEPEPDDLDGD